LPPKKYKAMPLQHTLGVYVNAIAGTKHKLITVIGYMWLNA